MNNRPESTPVEEPKDKIVESKDKTEKKEEAKTTPEQNENVAPNLSYFGNLSATTFAIRRTPGSVISPATKIASKRKRV